MNNKTTLTVHNNLHLGLMAFGLVSIGVAILLIFTSPRFANADDIRMSMTIHGYGQILIGSPYLMFSNILRGYIIQHLPDFEFARGYSIETYLTLFFSCWLGLFLLFKFDVPKSLACALIILIYGYNFEFPQFTITAGLLTASGLLGIYYYLEKEPAKEVLILSVIALLYGFITRADEFVFVLLLSAPILVTSFARANSFFAGVILALTFTMGLLTYIDYLVDNSSFFIKYTQFQNARSQYNDYQVANLILRDESIYKKYGLSKNDIRLVSRGFSFDESLSEPGRLSKMAAEVKFTDILLFNSQLIPQNLKLLIKFPMLPLFLVSLLGLVLVGARQPKFLVMFAFFITSIIGFTLIGRSGVTRIYYPILACLLILMIPSIKMNPLSCKLILSAGMLGALLLFGQDFASQLTASNALFNQSQIMVQEQIAPNSIIFNWNGFDFHYYYTLFPKTNLQAIHYDHSGVSSFFPYSVSNINRETGFGFVDQFTSSAGLLLMSENINLIKIYCQEHFSGELNITSKVKISETAHLYSLRCVPGRKASKP